MPRYRNLLLGLALGLSASLASAQDDSWLTTPPIIPPMPSDIEKGRIGAGVRTRKWRRKYNLHELGVILYQAYMARREKNQWVESLDSLTSMFTSEHDMHADYYDDLHEAPDFVGALEEVRDIYGQYKQTVKHLAATGALLDDAYAWANPEEIELLGGLALDLKSAAINSLRHLPAIVGLEPDDAEGELEDGEAVGEFTEEPITATVADRIRLLGEMRDEVVRVRLLARQLYTKTNALRANRTAGTDHRSVLEELYQARP